MKIRDVELGFYEKYKYAILAGIQECVEKSEKEEGPAEVDLNLHCQNKEFLKLVMEKIYDSFTKEKKPNYSFTMCISCQNLGEGGTLRWGVRIHYDITKMELPK